VIRLLDGDTAVVDPHSFLIRFREPPKTKRGNPVQDIGRLSEGLPPLILSKSKPLLVTGPVTIDAEAEKDVDFPPSFECDWAIDVGASSGTYFYPVKEVEHGDPPQ
jgi:hypothetical protein